MAAVATNVLILVLEWQVPTHTAVHPISSSTQLSIMMIHPLLWQLLTDRQTDYKNERTSACTTQTDRNNLSAGTFEFLGGGAYLCGGLYSLLRVLNKGTASNTSNQVILNPQLKKIQWIF